MTIESQIGKVTANGNGVSTTFSFSPMTIFTEEDLLVIKTVDGVETTITQGNGAAQYTLNVSDYPGTGSITYPSTGTGNILQTGETITMKRVLPLLQEINLENQGGYFPEVQEEGFDRGVAISIQQQEDIDRSIKFPVTYAGGVAPTLDAPVAGQYIRANSAGDALEFASITVTEASSSDDNPEDVSLSTLSAGTSDDFSRSDHVHQLNIGSTLSDTSDVLDVADGGVDTAQLADDAVTLAKMDAGTQGGIIFYGASGAPTQLGPGTDGQFLKTQGADANPVWDDTPPSIFTTFYESAELSIGVGDTHTLTHSLGGVPRGIAIWAVCTVDNLGYVAGERVLIGYNTDIGGNSSRGIAMKVTATQILIKLGTTAASFINFSTGGAGDITTSSWRLVVTAWR
jgi:hypothetical protein